MFNDYYNDAFNISLDLDEFNQILDNLIRHQKSVQEAAKQKMETPDFKQTTHICNCNCRKLPEIDNIIFSDPVTVVFWSDGTKTTVKASNGDKFSKELGIVYSVFKKLFGPNTSAAIEKMIKRSFDQSELNAAKRAEKAAKKAEMTKINSDQQAV